jgi:hypothetical protein
MQYVIKRLSYFAGICRKSETGASVLFLQCKEDEEEEKRASLKLR